MDQSDYIKSQSREPWNKGKLVGQKAPLRLREIWAIRIRLQLEERVRELALFNLAVDTATSDPAGAQRLYLRVVALQPTFAAAWLNLGFIVRDEGKLAEAKTDWAKAVALDASLASHVPTPAPASATKPVTPPSTSQP